jgi:hypothetical protein
MGNKRSAPKEVEARHVAALTSAAKLLAERRQSAWEAELLLRKAIREAFAEEVTMTPICEATGLSAPRLYQIKNEDPSTISATYVA